MLGPSCAILAPSGWSQVGPSCAEVDPKSGQCCGHVGSKRCIWTMLARSAKRANYQSPVHFLAPCLGEHAQLKLYQTDRRSIRHVHYQTAPSVRADFLQSRIALQLRTRPTGKEFHGLALNSNLQEPTNSTFSNQFFGWYILTDTPTARSSAFPGSFESLRCFRPPAGGHWQNVDVLGQNERGELHYAYLVYLRGSDLRGD